MFDAIAMGMSCFDFGIVMEKMPGFNENGKVVSVSWQGGGKTATGIVATARLFDGNYAFYGACGGQMGEFIANDFTRHGIDVSHMIRKEGQNSVLDVCIADRSNGGRSFCPCAPFTTSPVLDMEDIDPEFLKQTRYLFVADARPATLEAIRIVHENGGKVIVDADSYNEDILKNLKSYDIIIPSEFFYRTHFKGHEEDYEGNLKAFKALANPDATVIFTLGENGLIGLDENNEFFRLPAFKVDVMDTTGAGDVFHGAFLAAVLRGMDIKTAARFSSAVSAIKCTRVGGRAGIPTYDVVSRFLETGEIDYTEIDQRVAMYAQMPL
ncbi:MAG: carbohydrate kinase family protein [Clostridia bacterium]|nr:carbohydrate kinase family protein [Clostridia bacterium]